MYFRAVMRLRYFNLLITSFHLFNCGLKLTTVLLGVLEIDDTILTADQCVHFLQGVSYISVTLWSP